MNGVQGHYRFSLDTYLQKYFFQKLNQTALLSTEGDPVHCTTTNLTKYSEIFFVTLDWIGLDLLSGTGVATALRIVQWPTLSLTRPCALRLVVVLSKENHLQGYHWGESINSSLIENNENGG